MRDSTTINFREKYNIYLNKNVLNIIMQNYLSDRQFVVVYDILVLNYTQEEVAKKLKISQSTVSRHLNAGIKIIRHYADFLQLVINKGVNYD